MNTVVFCNSSDEINSVVSKFISDYDVEQPDGKTMDYWEKICDRASGIYISWHDNSKTLGHNPNMSDSEEMYAGWGFKILSAREFLGLEKQTSKQVSEIAPRNNDGRTICFWCGASTRKAGGGMYDICTACGK